MKKLIVIAILALLPMGQLFSQIDEDSSELRPIVSVVADGVVPCVPNKMFIIFGYIAQDSSEYSCRQKLIGLVAHGYELLRKNGIDTSLFNNMGEVFKTSDERDVRSLVAASAKKPPTYYYNGGLALISEGIYDKDFLTRVQGAVSKVPDIIGFEARFSPTKEQDDSLMVIATAKATENARKEAERLASLSNSKIIGVKKIIMCDQKSYQFDISRGNGITFGASAARNGAEITFSPKPFDYSQKVYIDYYIESK